jgi:hypothetical protein
MRLSAIPTRISTPTAAAAREAARPARLVAESPSSPDASR